jgi:type I restriction enzyme, S subunit
MTAQTLHASQKTKKTAIGDLPVEWAIRNLDELAKISSGGTPDRNQPEYWGGKIPWITTAKINYSVIERADEYITEQGLKHSAAKIFPRGTLLMAMYGQGGTRGRVAILGIDAATNQACCSIEPGPEVDVHFLFHFFTYNYERIRELGHGGNQSNLSGELIRQINVPVPPVMEQRSIAAVLAEWDRALDQLKKLVAANRRFKQGLMQHLLTGKRRFKSFTGEAWTTHRLSDLLERIFRPVTLSDAVPLDLISIRRRAGGLFFRGSFTAHEFKTVDLNRIEAGDFLVSKRQVTHGALAMVREPFAGMHVSNEYVIFRCKAPDKLHMPFFDWLARSPRMWYMAYLASNGVHIEKLIFDADDFLKEKIALPSIAEQQKIVGLLEASDTEIRLLQHQFSALKDQKRGLMQKLLTGKVRVRS